MYFGPNIATQVAVANCQQVGAGAAVFGDTDIADANRFLVLLFGVPIIGALATLAILIGYTFWNATIDTRSPMNVILVSISETQPAHPWMRSTSFLLRRASGGATWHDSDVIPSYDCPFPHVGAIKPVWLVKHTYAHRDLPPYFNTAGARTFCVS